MTLAEAKDRLNNLIATSSKEDGKAINVILHELTKLELSKTIMTNEVTRISNYYKDAIVGAKLDIYSQSCSPAITEEEKGYKRGLEDAFRYLDENTLAPVEGISKEDQSVLREAQTGLWKRYFAEGRGSRADLALLMRECEKGFEPLREKEFARILNELAAPERTEQKTPSPITTEETSDIAASYLPKEMLIDEFASLGPIGLNITEEPTEAECFVCKRHFLTKIEKVNGHPTLKAPICPECKGKRNHKDERE